MFDVSMEVTSDLSIGEVTNIVSTTDSDPAKGQEVDVFCQGLLVRLPIDRDDNLRQKMENMNETRIRHTSCWIC